ncbi:hypothetical protein DET57_11024 [Klebsiella oxytoca]|uniref:Uncharacterized protein n=1 Tax=Klebsiella oxytoca TaxID=571 RepID=A0A318FK97_KLEOX|nr:hypothetical protein DET57_11024 [Klebsiella oxytoca]
MKIVGAAPHQHQAVCRSHQAPASFLELDATAEIITPPFEHRRLPI